MSSGNLHLRRHIQNSMLEAVGSVGYDEATVGVVIGHAGISARVFDLEYESKAQCYLAAFDMAVDDIRATLVNATKECASWTERFRAGLACLLEVLDAEPKMARALIAEPHDGDSLTRKRWSQILEQAAEFVDLARLEPGALAPPAISGNAVVAGIYGVIRGRLQLLPESKVQDLKPDLLYYAVLPYFGPEAARKEKLAAKRP